jgi:hypothetical protein
MKTTFKMLGIIALAAIIGFSFIACGDGGGGGGGGGGGSYLGTEPGEIVNDAQVYTINDDDDDFEFVKFTGTLPKYTGDGYTVEITDGKLSLNLGTPYSLLTAAQFESEFSGDDSEWDNVKISPASAKGEIFGFKANDSRYLIKMNETHSGTYASFSQTIEMLAYIYVDTEVTFSGKGKTSYDDDGFEDTTKNFNLTLKQGWNTIINKLSGSGNTLGGKATLEMKMGNPSNLRWVLD